MKRFKYIKKKQLLLNLRPQLLKIKVVNFVSVGVLFFQLEWNVSVSECFGVLFRGLTVHIYIYIYIYIYIFKKYNSNSR
jgi:hypothetical protein